MRWTSMCGSSQPLHLHQRLTGTKSVTFCVEFPSPLIRQKVADTPPSLVTLTGGHVRLKSKVNSYVLGAQAQTSMPIPPWPLADPARVTRIPMARHHIDFVCWSIVDLSPLVLFRGIEVKYKHNEDRCPTNLDRS
jgi:hypothetical protein